MIGQHHKNPLLNMLMYDIEFPNGDVRKYAANIFAVNLLAQVDPEGYHTNGHGVILDHKRNGMAVPISGKYCKTRQGRQTQRKSTLVWALQIKWKNGSKQWLKLKDLKESNPVDVAVYATARGIQEEPAFSWWVTYTLRNSDMIVSAVSSRVRKYSHKYVI